MSEAITTSPITQPIDVIPILPESHPLEPIVQCGVLYLGTVPTNPSLGGPDLVQEPLSHRYPVDGTNTVRGIDAVLFVYDNGIQLTYTRQPHAAIFFPITSLIYCASLRFSVIENGEKKPTTAVEWRFMPLDEIINSDNKHPPLFCAVVERTHILPGDECHCFIAKSSDAALSLVQALARAYAKIAPGMQCIRSPVFYQLDRFRRKLSETTGVVYISPANDNDLRSDRTRPSRLTGESMARNYLLDSSFGGFFYRTDASLIEQWQLWDDDKNNLIRTRPRPPASPFGLHEGLYHDDTTHEIEKYLRHMDDEEHSSSCTCSSCCSSTGSSSSSSSGSVCSSSSSVSLTSTKNSQSLSRHHSNGTKSNDDIDEFHESLSRLRKSSFEPKPMRNKTQTKKRRKKPPIIIEKLVPKSIPEIPILNPKLPKQSLDSSTPVGEQNIVSISQSDVPSFSYTINARGEKITKEGNRIIFMDVVRPTIEKDSINSKLSQSSTHHHRSHRQPSLKPISVVNIQNIQQEIDKRQSEIQQPAKNLSTNDKTVDDINNKHLLKTSDILEIIDEYFEEYRGLKFKINNQETQSISNHSASSNRIKERSRSNTASSINSLRNGTRRGSQSVIHGIPSIEYVERPRIPSESSVPKSSSSVKQIPSTPALLNKEKLNEAVTNIYGTAQSNDSSSSSRTDRELNSFNKTAVTNSGYISAFRYMQSSMSSNLFREYRNAY